MKKLLVAIVLVHFGFIHALQAQDEPAQIPTSQKLVSVEVMKPLFWFMKNGGFVLEPEFIYKHKGLHYTVAVGYSSIHDDIYHDLEYENKGTHLKLGVGIQLNYNKEKLKSNHLVIGANLIFSSFTESATIINNFSSYGPLGQDLEQKNNSRGIETYFTYRRIFENNFYASISPSLSLVLSEIINDKFPVYYVPGFGIINNDDESTIISTPFTENGGASTVGLSIKIGYRF